MRLAIRSLCFGRTTRLFIMLAAVGVVLTSVLLGYRLMTWEICVWLCVAAVQAVTIWMKDAP